MYPLPDNASAADIIVRSLVCHPSLYGETLGEAARNFSRDAATLSFHSIRETAERLSRAASNMAAGALHCAGADDAAEIAAHWVSLGADHWTTALNLAARLQCLPRHVASEAAARITL